LCGLFFLFNFSSNAQLAFNNIPSKEALYLPADYSKYTSSIFSGRKLFQRNIGMIFGLQKGRYTAIELGGEAHWRKISLLKPHIIGATTNLEYNFSNNVIGYKAGMWMKRGRINLTYGANISYYSDFKDKSSFGFGPSVGFRLLGLHLVNGYNFLTKSKSNAEDQPLQANTLYMSLRYYFPVDNKFTWDRKSMKKKRERNKERAKRKKQREEERGNGEKKGLQKLFNINS
jgi:hypothetical protein